MLELIIFKILSGNVNIDLLKSSTRNWRLGEHNMENVATTQDDFNMPSMSCSPYANEVLANDGNKINK